jgi:hypothetical protein
VHQYDNRAWTARPVNDYVVPIELGDEPLERFSSLDPPEANNSTPLWKSAHNRSDRVAKSLKAIERSQKWLKRPIELSFVVPERRRLGNPA